jgi:hypothetical protein
MIRNSFIKYEYLRFCTARLISLCVNANQRCFVCDDRIYSIERRIEKLKFYANSVVCSYKGGWVKKQ